MFIRPIAGLFALSLAGAAQAATPLTLDTAALSTMLLLAAAGTGIVVFAMQERQREDKSQPAPVRLRKSIRRYNQP